MRININIILILSITFLTFSCKQYSGKIPPKPVKGFLDLSEWDFVKDGPVDLRGEWEFYWKQLLRPENFKNNIKPKVSTHIKVPSYWNGLLINDEKLTEDGFATYRLNIKTKDFKSPGGIYIKYQY